MEHSNGKSASTIPTSSGLFPNAKSQVVCFKFAITETEEVTVVGT
jgi:hypothetical protein